MAAFSSIGVERRGIFVDLSLGPLEASKCCLGLKIMDFLGLRMGKGEDNGVHEIYHVGVVSGIHSVG